MFTMQIVFILLAINLLYVTFTRRVPINYYGLAVSGVGYKTPKLVDRRGERIFVMPILQQANRVNTFILKNDLHYYSKWMQTKDGVKVALRYSVNVCNSDDNNETRKFVKSFTDLDNAAAIDKIERVVAPRVADIIGETAYEDLINHKDTFCNLVIKAAEIEFEKHGLHMLRFSVFDVEKSQDPPNIINWCLYSED